MNSTDILTNRRRTRLALSLGILGGLLTIAFFALFRQNPPETFGVFYFAAKSSMSGEIAYHTGHGLWTYTPASLFYFYPYASLFDFETARLVHQILSVFVAVIYGVTLAGFIDTNKDIQTLDKILIVGFTGLSVYPVVNIVNASFVGMFTACLGIGWVLLESDRDLGGAAWALASLVKGYPAFWGVYLLRVKRWRATGAAIATGLGATLLGMLAFGYDAYVRFFTVAGTSRVRYHMFRGGASPDNEAMTPLRGLAQVFPNIDPSFWTPVIVVVVAGLTLWMYYSIPTDTLNDRATLFLATILGVMFIMPTSQDMDTYLVYAPLLTLLYVERRTVVHSLYVVATIVLSYNISQDELQAVSNVLGGYPQEFIMQVSGPIFAFAKMPMYALYLLYFGCLVYAFYRGKEVGRLKRPSASVINRRK